MEETKQHGDAFDYYYTLGEKRTYVSVADRIHVVSRTVERWSKAFNWKERVIQRDLEINRKTEEKTNKAIVNTKADYRAEIGRDLQELDAIGSRIIRLLADVADKIKSDDSENNQEGSIIEINSIEDLDKMMTSLKKYRDIKKDLVKLDLELIGDSEGVRDLNINVAKAIVDGNYYTKS